MSFKDELLSRISKLEGQSKDAFDRIYRVHVSSGRVVIPAEMKPWVKGRFGDISSVESQSFIKILNKVTGEGAIFNELRTKRPVVKDPSYEGFRDEIENSEGGHFSSPLTRTPEDIFGRIKGKYCITASNIAKYDGFHGLIIFNTHNPLDFNVEKIEDYINVAKEWFKKAHAQNANAIYPLFTWNCLWKAGASVIHGHAQVALTEGIAYAKVEQLRRQVSKYQDETLSGYFDDLFEVYSALGLGIRAFNTRIYALLTPIKDKEVMICADGFNAQLAKAINLVLSSFRDSLGVSSFNLAMYLPPLKRTDEHWSHMPIIIRIVDRGSLSSKTADIGSMELYAQSVIGVNPYNVISAIKKNTP